jgi:hypothetical protein
MSLDDMRQRKLTEARKILQDLGFGPRRSNDIAGYTLLALAHLRPEDGWDRATAPLRRIKDIMDFIKEYYGITYAANTRETIRDEAVKYFAAAGLLLTNPDQPDRPRNSGKYAYQIEGRTLELLQCYGKEEWEMTLDKYLKEREQIRRELERARNIPVTLSPGKEISLSPGGQNNLIKNIIEEFCPRFAKEGVVIYIGDASGAYIDKDYANCLGMTIEPDQKMPDVLVYDPGRDWLFVIEAVTSSGSIDGKRRKELKELFQCYKVSLIFVTAFENRKKMRRFLDQISWDTEVWIASNPDHLIHFDGERFLMPYPDTNPGNS